jgi:hypothetical protein
LSKSCFAEIAARLWSDKSKTTKPDSSLQQQSVDKLSKKTKSPAQPGFSSDASVYRHRQI